MFKHYNHAQQSTVVRKERCPRCNANGRDRSGDNLAIYPDHKFCFSCGYYSTDQFNNVSQRHVISQELENKTGLCREKGVPIDRIFKKTSKNNEKNAAVVSPLLWLHSFGVGQSLLSKYTDCNQNDPMVIEFYVLNEKDEKVRTIFRRFPDKKIFIKIHSSTPWSPVKNPLLLGTGIQLQENKKSLVFVEDCISAMKIAQAGHLGYPLLSTNMSSDRLYGVLRRFAGPGGVRVWLDPDKRPEALKMASKLNQLGYGECKAIFSEMDPKYYGHEYINAQICNDI